MTEGSGLYLAGPALVKSAIGQVVSQRRPGRRRDARPISGTIDFREPDDEACLDALAAPGSVRSRPIPQCRPRRSRVEPRPSRPGPATDIDQIVVGPNPRQSTKCAICSTCLLDAGTFDEYKAEYGQSLVCGTARLGGFPVGIVANQHHRSGRPTGPVQFGGVIYVDSADKAARFVMDCNQDWLPIIFLQDVNGFMVGRDSEQAGIIKAGAKLVNVISNSLVPKLTVILGGSFGAGNYALCGKAFDPRLIFAWPTARYAVMGGEQATRPLLDITVKSLERQGQEVDADELAELREQGAGRLRAADRHPLRRRPRLGRPDHRPRADPRRTDFGPGDGHAPRRAASHSAWACFRCKPVTACGRFAECGAGRLKPRANRRSRRIA